MFLPVTQYMPDSIQNFERWHNEDGFNNLTRKKKLKKKYLTSAKDILKSILSLKIYVV